MNKKLLTISIVLFLIAIAISIFTFKSIPNSTYVDVTSVYNNFEFKKDLEKKLNHLSNIRTNKLDSIELDLNIMFRSLNSEGNPTDDQMQLFNTKKQNFLNLKRQYEEEYANLAKEYDDQIYAQINQYILDYGESTSYEYIFGATGSGNLMYAKDSENITEEVLKYINNRYKGNVK